MLRCRFRGDECTNKLPEFFVFHACDHGLCHVRERKTLPFNVNRGDLVTSRLDDVDRCPSDDGVEGSFSTCNVTRLEPAVFVMGVQRRFSIIKISATISADLQLLTSDWLSLLGEHIRRFDQEFTLITV